MWYGRKTAVGKAERTMEDTETYSKVLSRNVPVETEEYHFEL
jgi:hypothetical protein